MPVNRLDSQVEKLTSQTGECTFDNDLVVVQEYAKLSCKCFMEYSKLSKLNQDRLQSITASKTSLCLNTNSFSR